MRNSIRLRPFLYCRVLIERSGHDLPQEANRVDLDPHVRDAWGMPVARITHSWGKIDYQIANFVMDKGEQLLKEAGGWLGAIAIPPAVGFVANRCGVARGVLISGGDSFSDACVAASPEYGTWTATKRYKKL